MYVSLVTLGVADLEASTRFYERLSWERSAASVDGEVTFLRGGNVVLGLYPLASFADEVGRPASATGEAVALAINVASPEVVDAVLAAAVEAGAEVVRAAGEMDWGGYAGHFADLDGHLWEVAHNPFAEVDGDGRLELEPGEGHLTPEQTRAHLAAFRERTDAQGTPVAELADAVSELVDEVGGRIAALFADEPRDKAIATMTELTDRAMQADPGSDRAMRLSAASTLASEHILR